MTYLNARKEDVVYILDGLKPRRDNQSEISFFVFLNAYETWFTCTWQ
jgi:hypothetical protein